MFLRYSVAALLMVLAGCDGDGDPGSPGSGNPGTNPPIGSEPPAPKIIVQPMTSVDATSGTGYFQDPYPIHTSRSDGNPELPTFSGTNKQTLSCVGSVGPKCFMASPISLDTEMLAQQTAAAGSTIRALENLNVYQDSTGKWQMAFTAHLTAPGLIGWNIILHAHPTIATAELPRSWVADTLLVGSLSASAPNNYDGKYFEDAGTMYLIYNKKVGPYQDGVVAQAMTSPTQPALSSPVPLLGPETTNGGYSSEFANGLNQTDAVKLIETGNLTKINGKYIMTYSTGTFNQIGYKAGIAYSDTFLPRTGSYYRRVNKIDTDGVWGRANHEEVLYLLQSQLPKWANYVADQVLAPGVPAIVRDHDGVYYLTFAGYDPQDAPRNASGLFDGSHRRPYYIKLNVQMPSGGTVAGASPQELAAWVRPAS